MYTVQDIRNMTPAELSPESLIPLRTLCKSLGFELGFATMVENKESMQDALREVNKLTAMNMHARIPEIVSIVNRISNKDEFCSLFYEVILKNAFFANVYAALYTALMCPLFQDEFYQRHTAYLASLSMREELPERRAFTAFMIQLVKLSTLSADFVYMAIGTVMSNMETCIDDAQAKSYLYELVELLLMLKPTDSESIKLLRTWSSADLTSHPGLSHKIQFRMMDVLK